MRTCNVSDCGTKHYGHGYCRMHYQRWRSHGDTQTVKIGHRYQPIDARARLEADSERRGACLVYTRGKPSRSGHRLISFEGKMQLVHRVAWRLAHGPIPPKLCVLHRCDVPDCFDIDHLFLGTVADNNRDRDRKGRQVAQRGSKQPRAKLSEWQVQQVRERHAAGEAILALAREFTVSQRALQLAVHGQTWRHVRTPVVTLTDEAIEKYRKKLTAADIPPIKAAAAEGATFTTIAKRFGVTRGAIANIVHGRTWKSIV